MPELLRVMSRCGETSLPQSLQLWSPLPPLLVRLGSVPQAFWRWSQNVCTDRWRAAHQQPPFHPCQDSAVPFCRGRSLRPGWNTEGGFKSSQEWSLMKNQRTGRAGSGFVAVRWGLVLGENDVPAALGWSRLLFLITSKCSNIQRWIWSVCWESQLSACKPVWTWSWLAKQPFTGDLRKSWDVLWERRRCCPATCFGLALLSPNHFKIYQNVQKRKVPRQSFSCSWGQWKPPLTSLNTRKDCLSLKKNNA